jgi:hypothetical protein
MDKAAVQMTIWRPELTDYLEGLAGKYEPYHLSPSSTKLLFLGTEWPQAQREEGQQGLGVGEADLIGCQHSFPQSSEVGGTKRSDCQVWHRCWPAERSGLGWPGCMYPWQAHPGGRETPQGWPSS